MSFKRRAGFDSSTRQFPKEEARLMEFKYPEEFR
jgi:hypothetical protein